MPSNLILILISAAPVYLMWSATGRISAARLVPIEVKSRRPASIDLRMRRQDETGVR